MAAASLTQERWYELGLWVAYHTAVFTRTKRLPAWKSIRPKKDKTPGSSSTGPTRQSWMDIKAALKMHTDAVEDKAAMKSQARKA